MATVLPHQIQVNDVVEVPAHGDFQRRGARTTFGIVREIVFDPADPAAVKRLVLFEMLPDNGRLRSRHQYVPLMPGNLPAYGLPKGQAWVAVIDPVGIDIAPEQYYVTRTGHLRDDDAAAIRKKIYDLGGEQILHLGGTGPGGYAQADWNKIVSPGFERRLPSDDEEARPRAVRRPSIRSRGSDPNKDRVIDLPLVFATRVTDLSPGLVDALRAKGVESLRTAWEMSYKPEIFNAFVPQDPASLPALTIDDAITAAYLRADTRGLGFVTEPIDKKSRPIATLNDLYELTRNGGAGFAGYVGLASKTAKARLELTAATEAAWSAYSASLPAAGTAATQIQREWGKLLTEYTAAVRPHLNDHDLSQMRAPEKIPEKFIHDGKLVFTFAPRPARG